MDISNALKSLSNKDCAFQFDMQEKQGNGISVLMG